MDDHDFGPIGGWEKIFGELRGTFTPPVPGKYTLEISNYRNSDLNTINNYIDKIKLTPQNYTFSNTGTMIPANTGGTSDFTFMSGTHLTGKPYIIVGGMHGSMPGMDLGNAFLPLNVDQLTFFILERVNRPVFQNFESAVSFPGQATAVFDTRGPLLPSFAGATITFVLVVMEGQRQPPVLHVSNPVMVSFY